LTVFHVGQKVVCVNDQAWPRAYGYTPKLPKCGVIYTIRAIIDCRAWGYDEDGLLLAEIVNPKRIHVTRFRPRLSEVKFRMSRFRPVRTTNIDVFLKMLEPDPLNFAEADWHEASVDFIGWVPENRTNHDH
jgi:hypothetical protein